MAVEVSLTGRVAPQLEGGQPRSTGRSESPGSEHIKQEATPVVQRPDPGNTGLQSSNRREQQADPGAVTRISDVAQRVFRDLQFSVDKDSGNVVVKVVDRGTGDVVRQIPAEELLQLARTLGGLQPQHEQPVEPLTHGPGRGGDSDLSGILISTKA